jgi:hypothetical protein
MKVAAEFSFNNGATTLAKRWQKELDEVYSAIAAVDAAKCRTKISKEKTMPGKRLNDPKALNRAFKRAFGKLGWQSCKVQCDYTDKYYRPDYSHRADSHGAFREMDFVKNKLGVEVQFGKYAFMVYNVCAKMTIFHKLGHIDAGVEIVPVKKFADQMSTGVSYFEQFVWDLEKRGVSNIDLPVLIIGIDG